MIFITVGTQLPFDRLLKMMDNISTGVHEEFYAQIGNSKYIPKNFPSQAKISRQEFASKLANARLIVAHAGIGSVISARMNQKHIIVVPREKRFGEHRNDHQLATVKHLAHYDWIHPATSETELKSLIATTMVSSQKNEPPKALIKLEEFISTVTAAGKK